MKLRNILILFAALAFTIGFTFQATVQADTMENNNMKVVKKEKTMTGPEAQTKPAMGDSGEKGYEAPGQVVIEEQQKVTDEGPKGPAGQTKPAAGDSGEKGFESPNEVTGGAEAQVEHGKQTEPTMGDGGEKGVPSADPEYE